MKQQPEMSMRPSEFTAQERAWVSARNEELQREVALFSTQLSALEQQHARSSTLSKLLGRAFGFGPAGKLEGARFKLDFKQEQLAQFKALYQV